MDATLWVPVLLAAVGLAVHLWADGRHRSWSDGLTASGQAGPARPEPAPGRAAPGWSLLRALGKGLASAAFLLLAGLDLAPERYGLLMLAGLALSAAGDLLLLGRATAAFLAGVGAFLGAHVAYAVAFAPRSSPPLLAVALLAGLAGFVVHRLWPRLGALRLPVSAYAGAISVMLLLALGVPDRRVQLGAALFYLSDLTVARDRFVAPGRANGLVGLPLYYAGQLLLAWTARAG